MLCSPEGHVTQPHVQHKRPRRLLTGLPVASPVYKLRSIFFSGGEGVGGRGVVSWEVVIGECRPALLILTPSQSNIYKVNVREYLPPPGDLCPLCFFPSKT